MVDCSPIIETDAFITSLAGDFEVRELSISLDEPKYYLFVSSLDISLPLNTLSSVF